MWGYHPGSSRSKTTWLKTSRPAYNHHHLYSETKSRSSLSKDAFSNIQYDLSGRFYRSYHTCRLIGNRNEVPI